MARTVEGARAAAAQPTAVPPGIDIDNIPDMPEEIASSAPRQETESKEGQKQRGEYKYEPSAKTLQKLDSFKHWDEVKEKFGIDIERIKQDARRYGVLEGLAYGSFTTEPLFLTIKADKQKSIKDFFTVRLYTNPENGDWGIETHRVGLKYKKDKDGNYVNKPDGTPAMTFDRNEIKEGDAVKYNGNYLSKEEVDHLRLTGTLGRALQSTKFNGQTVLTVLCPDPFNQHELIGLSSEVIRARLFTPNGRIFKDSGLTFEPTDKQLGELAVGKIVEVSATEDNSKKRFLMYDTAQGSIRKTVSYEYALKKELARKEQEDLGRKLAKEQSQSKSQAQGTGR